VGNHLYESLGFREVARQIHFAADLGTGKETIDLDETSETV
jgi:ribosomal protein S18 acetylase RimI-like enzyme